MASAKTPASEVFRLAFRPVSQASDLANKWLTVGSILAPLILAFFKLPILWAAWLSVLVMLTLVFVAAIRLQHQLDAGQDEQGKADTLGRFMTTGRHIQTLLVSEARHQLSYQTQRLLESWERDTRAYLDQHLSYGHVARFESSNGLTATAFPSVPMSWGYGHECVEAWIALDLKLQRLHEILKEVQKG